MLADRSSANGSAPESQRQRPKRIPWRAIECVGIYAITALVAYWPTWPGDPNRIIDCSCGDPSQAAWFLAWTPYAIIHGVNPFFTTVINHPAGINLAVNTEMPLLGLLTSPLTLLFGPVASLNLLVWLAYPISASAMLLVLRRWTTWYPAAFVGGLLYGFSPYVIGQGRLHLNLVFVPLPPLIALATYEIFVKRTGSPVRWGALLGILVIAQFFISTEILASTFIVVVIGLAVLGASHPHKVLGSARMALPGIGTAACIVVIVLAYPTWMMLRGPQRYDVPYSFMNLRSGRSGLLSAFAPTSSMWFAPRALSELASATPGFTDIVENGSYLGIPLVLLALYLVARFRKHRWLPFMFVMALATYLLTLGPHLNVGANRTSVTLPFAYIERLPLVRLLNPIRMSLFVAMFVSMIVGLGLDRCWATWAQGSADRFANATRVPLRSRVPHLELALIALLLVSSGAFLIPHWPVKTSPAGIPPYFTSPSVDRIQPGGIVLVYPYPVPGAAQGMLWQAMTGMRFDVLGSYALNPDSEGMASEFPKEFEPSDVQRLLYEEEGVTPTTSYVSRLSPDNPSLVGELRRFLLENRVDTVLVAQGTARSRVIAGVVGLALGGPPVRSGQVNAWYGVQTRLRHGVVAVVTRRRAD